MREARLCKLEDEIDELAPTVFISYASEDEIHARELYVSLEPNHGRNRLLRDLLGVMAENANSAA
jgi:hypothetical protein